ncbi:MAG: alpha/beta hydrolase [Fimbriimonadaceae bacterium]
MIGFVIALLALGHSATPTVTVSYPKDIMGLFSGSIYVFVSPDATAEPRLGPEWKNPGAVFVASVKRVKPDTEITIDDTARGTAQLSSLSPGVYTFQAVIDRNPASPRVGDGDGNLYSAPVQARVGEAGAQVKLFCDQVIDEPTVHVSATVKVVELESTPISNAQRRSVIWRAAVVLPKEFSSEPSRKFPMLVDIPDRSDSYAAYPARGTDGAAYRDGKPFLYVRLDPVSASGYHLMVNSANAGPYATALVKEFLPYVAKEYHGDLSHVAVCGIGAGGWSALWLQVTEPSAFAGCWAVQPDSVDFHALHGLDLYADANALTTPSGDPRRWTRDGETWAKHAAFEGLLRGFRIAGWESDFSPKGRNGRPVPLFNRATGAIDPVVAKAWTAYDLDAIAKAAWPKLGPQLANKVHIYASDGDADFDADALKLFQADLVHLGAQPHIEWLARDLHRSRLQHALSSQIDRSEADACYPVR